jgi:hypothetical protein
VCKALYSPSNCCSTAVNRPNEGDMFLIKIPLAMYQAKVRQGPVHPTSSANFLLNNTMSRIGFVVFKYRLAKLLDHFSASDVRR